MVPWARVWRCKNAMNAREVTREHARDTLHSRLTRPLQAMGQDTLRAPVRWQHQRMTAWEQPYRLHSGELRTPLCRIRPRAQRQPHSKMPEQCDSVIDVAPCEVLLDADQVVDEHIGCRFGAGMESHANEFVTISVRYGVAPDGVR